MRLRAARERLGQPDRESFSLLITARRRLQLPCSYRGVCMEGVCHRPNFRWALHHTLKLPFKLPFKLSAQATAPPG